MIWLDLPRQGRREIAWWLHSLDIIPPALDSDFWPLVGEARGRTSEPLRWRAVPAVDDPEERTAALEAKVQEPDTLVNLALRLLAVEKPLSALLARFGASEAEDRAVHALLDDVIKRVEAAGIHTPAFSGFLSDLVKRFPAVRGDREFVSLLLDTLKIERPAYQKLHAFVIIQGWPHWHESP